MFSPKPTRGVELVLPNFYFFKCQDKQDIYRTPVINQDFLHIEVGDGSRDDQSVVVGEMQASQVVIGEADGLMSSSCRRGKVVNFFFSLPTSTLGMSPQERARASS